MDTNDEINEKLDSEAGDFELDDIELSEEGAVDYVGKIKKLKKELAACQKEKGEYLAGWQRAKADYLNLKKEEAERREEVGKYAKADVLNDLIMLADSFEMAFANKEAWSGLPENWRKGVEYIHNQLLVVFRDHGLEELNPQGEMFDPARDQSVGAIATDKQAEEGRVLEVVKKGYRLNGKILRPAQVRIGEYK